MCAREKDLPVNGPGDPPPPRGKGPLGNPDEFCLSTAGPRRLSLRAGHFTPTVIRRGK